jgi:hypothetical protein
VTLLPARSPRHLHVFALSLCVIVGALMAFLFGMKMEATAPATGIVTPLGAGSPPNSELFGNSTAIRLEFEEKSFGAVEPGQEVRLYSNMYHHQTHGIARGEIVYLEPSGVEGPNNTRLFHAWVKVIEAPFAIRPGSSFRAEVVTGKKRTYQIIVEH